MSPRGQERSPDADKPAPQPKSKSKKRAKGSWRRRWLVRLALVALLALIPASLYVAYLGREISRTFEGLLWTFPTRVYSAPLQVRLGAAMGPARIRTHLDLGLYAKVSAEPATPGQYRSTGNGLEIFVREFAAADRQWPKRRIKVQFRDGRVALIQDIDTDRSLAQIDLEPVPVAYLYGESHEERTILPLSAYPKSLTDAILAAEDQRFYAHHGVDPIGILRALFEDIRSGSLAQGGSTITQQTVKNIYLTRERKFGRKLKEALMAVILEARYPKDRILEVYMNEVYLGQRGGTAICGFGEASRFYFSKEAADLDIAESAMLAGVIRAPSATNPIAHPDRAAVRKNAVIQQMLDMGRLTPEQAKRATATMPAIAKGGTSGPRARYFSDEVRREIEAEIPEAQRTSDGLRIITTLDPWLQKRAESAIEQGLARLEKDRPGLVRKRGGPIEACLIALRPGTGEILALVGGRDYGESQFNRITQAQRQPGSLFKPFVYATGFEKGREDTGEPFTPATVLEDEPLSLQIAGKEWTPQNYDEEFRGRVTARQALEGSLNVPTVRAALAIGVERIVEVGQAAGMGKDLKAYPSIALGAQEVVPMDAAAAFATFASGGRRPRPYAVTSISDAQGKLLASGAPQATTVLSPQAAYLTLDLLRGVIDRGTAAALREHGLTGDFAGKTGTTNDKRDAWFVGFRPDLLVLVWVGFDDGSETHMTGAQGALPIWEGFMRGAGEFGTELTFDRPGGIVLASIDPTTGGLATDRCPEAIDEIFIDGQLPAECPDHVEGPLKRFWRRLFGNKPQSHPGINAYDND